MNIAKKVSVIQLDNPQNVSIMLRGLSVLSLKNNKRNIVIDLRPNSSITWAYYGRQNVKFLDDITNILSNINISMLKTYLDMNNEVLCLKNRTFLSDDNLSFILNSLAELYDNIFISCDVSDEKIKNFISLSDIALVPLSKEPIGLTKYGEFISEFFADGGEDINFIPIIFKTNIDYNIDEKESVIYPKNAVNIDLSSNTINEIQNSKFMFNDGNNEFVKSVNKVIEFINADKNFSLEKDKFCSLSSPQYFLLKDKLHKDLIEEMKEYSNEQNKNVLSNIIKLKISKLLSKYEVDIDTSVRNKISKELVDDIVGLGVIEDLLADETITEIMVNGTDNIYVERKGKIEKTDIKFVDEEKLKVVINRIVSSVGRHIDEASPIVDARLKDGSRVNAVISPISLQGPVLTIRKFSKHKLTAEELINYGSITQEMINFLKNAVSQKKNILISGGTGSGKTTLLNIVSSFINDKERIVTIEDSAELQLQQEHVVRLESRPKSLEGTSEITIRQLVVNSLRMRPDRIIVGECRAGETLDMLQAMNTGHSGSMTTVHSNSCRDAISRLVVMSLMAGFELPEKSIISMIVSAIDIVVQVSRFPDGSRKVTEISLLEKDENSAEGYKIKSVFKI